jgi:DNA-binding NarL/FixJ family response regulator
LLEVDELALTTTEAALRRDFPQIACVPVLGDCGDPAVIRHALELSTPEAVFHAAAYKQVPLLETQLREAIRSVLACEQWLPSSLRASVARSQSSQHDRELAARLASLSPQQFRVLTLVAEGLLNKQIADRLDVQERTVKAHLTAIFERMGVRNRTQAGVILRELELSDPARQIES